MKKRLISIIIIAVLILIIVLCIVTCQKKKAETVQDVTQMGETEVATRTEAVSETDTENEKATILENEGELEIIIPEGQDSVGE